MKTAKKLFSLLLVAVLMLSAIPFQVFAEGETGEEETLPVHIRFRFIDTADNSQVGDITTHVVTANSDGSYSWASAPTAPANYTFGGWYLFNKGTEVTAFNVGAGQLKPNNPDNPTVMYADFYGRVTEAHQCVFNENSEIVEEHGPDCTNAGYKILECTGADCDETQRVTTEGALGHLIETTTIPATPTAPGSTVEECQREGCTHSVTTPIAQETTRVTFVDVEGNEDDQYADWLQGSTITVNMIPQVPDLPNNRVFEGWFTQPNGLGNELETGNWNSGKEYFATTYYSYYRDSTYSSAASVKVYATISGSAYPYKLGELAFKNGDFILTELMNNRQTYINKFFNDSGFSANDYEVVDQAFYKNVSGTDKITDGTTVANGTTSVYIKFRAKNSAMASVQLFVHTKVNSDYDLYDLTGFVAGNEVTDTYIKNFLKNKTGKSYNITGMYDQYNWDRLCAGLSNEGDTCLEIPSDGKLRIHIIAPSYTTSNAITSKPASNPATGDNSMIEITAGIMLLAAAAVVTLTQLRKRKMI